MIAIVNVDENVKNDGPHEYELRINRRVVCRFVHHREESLHECLLHAAIAAEKKATPKNGMIKPLLEPLYDETFLNCLTWLNEQ